MSSLSPSRSHRLADLRAEVRAIEAAGRRADLSCLPFGVEAMDARLAGGGLAYGALHEIAGASPALSDDAAASLFIAGIAARLSQGKGIILWALARRDLFAPGLAQAGVRPNSLIQAECGGDEEVLAVMEDALRHGGIAAVVGETARAGMAATRRLQLAAEEGGTTALMLRRWRRGGEEPLSPPSSAVTRWRIGCVPSGALPVEDAIGRPRWNVELARQRGGDPFSLIMEGSDAEGRLALPALSSDRPDQAAGRQPTRRAA